MQILMWNWEFKLETEYYPSDPHKDYSLRASMRDDYGVSILNCLTVF